MQLQQKLDGAIPVWAKGLVSVDLMVQTYGFVILGLTLYLLGSGMMVARHYHGLADSQGWSAEERSDPVLSSPWTLTWRGSLGTLATVGCYAGVFAALWMCLTLGLRSVGEAGFLTSQPWLAHGVMLLSIVAAVVVPLRSRPTGGTQKSPGHSRSRGT